MARENRSYRGKILGLAFLIAGLATSGCERECRKARDRILEPLRALEAYLATNPTGEELALTGCPSMLEKVRDFREAAARVRALAAKRYHEDPPRCARETISVSYDCFAQPYPERPYCYGRPYAHCSEWSLRLGRDAGFAEAIDYSTELNLVFEEVNRICGLTAQKRDEEAYAASRALLGHLANRMVPDTERAYALACGS